MNEDDKIFVAGHRGMVGQAIVKKLISAGFTQLITRTRQQLDLCDAAAVDAFYRTEQPAIVIIAAARVGGIHANSHYPAEFLHENLAIAHNLIHSAHVHNAKRVLFLGSSCIYPRAAPQPMPEECLLTSPLEHTNEAYAIAKIAGLKLCQYYRQQYGVLFHSVMPTNLYGPGDNYHLENAHVMPALIRKFHEAKQANAPQVVLWGTGAPRRELLHVDDLAAGILHLLNMEDPPDWMNIGFGTDVTIRELAEIIKDIVGYTGAIVQDPTKPDGTPRKLMDNSRIFATGWRPAFSLHDGIQDAYEDFLRSEASGYVRQA